MGNIFFIKQGDTAPALLYDLPDGIDVTGATAVKFSMRMRGSTTPVIVLKAGNIVSPSGPATLRYAWAVGETDVAGVYEAEFEVTRADGSIETFPNDDDYIDIHIPGQIA